MRKAFDRIVELYKTNPIYQDLIETTLNTGIATGGQALFTDMTGEELALAAAVNFGSGMVGRPLLGPVGGYVGRQVNTHLMPRVDSKYVNAFDKARHQFAQENPKQAAVWSTKYAPYLSKGMSIPEATGNIIGRGWGDNVAQTIAAVAMPQLFRKEEEQE